MSIMNLPNPLGVNTSDATAGSNGEVYSTEEARIGTWIDGKPLYRKTFHSRSTEVSSQYGKAAVLANVPDNLELCTGLYGTFSNINSPTLVHPLPYISGFYTSSGAGVYCVLRIENDKIISFTNNSNFPIGDFIFMASIEYTKTTDEPETA